MSPTLLIQNEDWNMKKEGIFNKEIISFLEISQNFFQTYKRQTFKY